MINIFEVFLPQLLRYPNPNDPLNGEAAALLMRHPKEYEQKVKGTQNQAWYHKWSHKKNYFFHGLDYVQRFATKEAANAAGGSSKDDKEDEEDRLSDVGSFSDPDDESWNTTQTAQIAWWNWHDFWSFGPPVSMALLCPS